MQLDSLPASGRVHPGLLEVRNPEWIETLRKSPAISAGKDKYSFIASKSGKGKFGAVFRAIDHGSHMVAVKMREAIKSQDGLMWAAVELQVLLTLTGHPNVVGFHEVFFSDGIVEPNRVMFVMEMCRSSLADYLYLFRSVFEEDRLAWSRDLCTGLGHMHASNVIHRDLKPANLLLQRQAGTRDMLKLSDFGNSGIVVADSGHRPLPSDHIALQQGLCTLNYAAPEILQKLQYDFKSDVWSAGVIMYEMLQENPSSIAIKASRPDTSVMVLPRAKEFIGIVSSQARRSHPFLI